MSNHFENKLEWIERMKAYQKARKTVGYKHPGPARLYEAITCSGLPSACKGFEDAENLLLQEVAADILNPSQPFVMPPTPAVGTYVILGHTAEGEPVWARHSDWCLGSVIVGAPGSGKTFLLNVIINGTPRNVLLYAGDTKKELYRILCKTHRRFLYAKPGQLYIGVLECPVADATTYYTGFMEYLARYLGIEDATWPEIAMLLIKIRTELPVNVPMPSLVEFIAFLRKTADTTKKSKFQTAAVKFMVLAIAYGEVSQVRSGPDLFSRYSAIAVDHTGVAHNIRNATDFRINYSYIQRLSASGHDTGKLRILFPADEGLDTWGRAFSSNDGTGRLGFMDVLAAQSRSYGMGRIVLLQFIRQGMDSVFRNAGIIIIMRLPDPDEARLAARYLNLSDDMIAVIQNLQPREAIVKSPSYPAVKITVCEAVLDDYPSSYEISRVIDPEIKWMRENSVISPLKLSDSFQEIDFNDLINASAGPSEIKSTYDVDVVSGSVLPLVSEVPPIKHLLDNWRLLLMEVLAHPDVGITAHYKTVGFSGSVGVRVKTELMDAGLLTEKTLTSKTCRPIIQLIVTELGKRSLEAMDHNEK